MNSFSREKSVNRADPVIVTVLNNETTAVGGHDIFTKSYSIPRAKMASETDR